ncbi:MAG: hypothetical protein K5905_29000 [Roseibium sp.]|uniref:hypothetical protein n=1 Tax=Roseibium sp. TaxID=1936156 RepID=UPI002614AC4A|nr:hypothetical protein [Roseibium sp.]MCV0429500.1 hypothetical protein [Roseibium sp.]
MLNKNQINQTGFEVDLPKIPLKAGSIIAESFPIFFRCFSVILILGYIPTALGLAGSSLLIGTNAALGLEEAKFVTPGDTINFISAMVLEFVVASVTTALLVQLAYDAKLRRTLHFKRYILPTLKAFLPIAVLGLIVSVLSVLGIIALIIPGLWISAVFIAVPPAIVIERKGFAALARSVQLTRGYRWPIALVLVMAIVWSIAFEFFGQFLVGLVDFEDGVSLRATVYSVVSTVGVGWPAILTALTYARLREIKEGISVDQIAEVFE